ncbi:DoxX family protein [Runella sp.]|uniref:DoxX family protein n=1 Tax=Runella sp. TaxID=1960881 RepID=UPI003D0F7CEE
MNTIQRIEHWGDTHHPAWMDVLRIALGLLLFMKGVSFISDTSQISELVNDINFTLSSVIAVHYVAFAHLMGGFLIALGCQTRLAIIFQLPILFVAVFFVNLTRGFSYLNSELWLSLTTLILLMIFLVIGSGKFSMDEWMKNHPH